LTFRFFAFSMPNAKQAALPSKSGRRRDQNAKSEGRKADATDLGEMVASRQSQTLNAFSVSPGPTKLARSLRVDVARYAQAVLMANVEEARYQVLITGEGKSSFKPAMPFETISGTS
jgi:hypothetical protein